MGTQPPVALCISSSSVDRQNSVDSSTEADVQLRFDFMTEVPYSAWFMCRDGSFHSVTWTKEY